MKTASYKGHTVKIMMGVMIMFMLVLPMVSALEWDNLVDYDKTKEEVIITNAFGLGEDLVKHTLIENTYNCGDTCNLKMKSNYYVNGSLYDDIRFISLTTNNEVSIKEYDFYIVEEDIVKEEQYKTNCFTLINGTSMLIFGNIIGPILVLTDEKTTPEIN